MIIARGNDAVVSFYGDKVRKDYCVLANYGNTPLTLERICEYQSVIAEINAELHKLEDLNYGGRHVSIRCVHLENIELDARGYPVAYAKYIPGNNVLEIIEALQAGKNIPELMDLGLEDITSLMNMLEAQLLLITARLKLLGIWLIPCNVKINVMPSQICLILTDLCPAIRELKRYT